MTETQMEKRVFEDLSGAEGTTLRQLLIKYRDELVPTFKSAKTLTYKINYMLKFRVGYYNLLQLNSAHINRFKKEISQGRAPKTINAYIDTLKRVWDLARTEWGITLPPQSPFSLVTMLPVKNERDITLTDEQFAKLIEEAGKIYIKSSRQKVIGKANWGDYKFNLNKISGVLDYLHFDPRKKDGFQGYDRAKCERVEPKI